MKVIQRGAVVAAALLLCCAGSLRAQVLNQVPADALVVFKVNNLKGTSDKVAKLSQDLGIAAMVAQAADPLAALQVEARIEKGLDTAGELAIVMLDPAAAGGDPEQALMVLLPVTDYRTFLGNWPNAQTQGAISQVKLGENQEDAYVTNWGKYAAISPNRAVIANKPSATIRVPAVTSKELSGKDAIFYANFEAIRGKLLPQVQQGRNQIMQELNNNMGGQNAQQMQRMAPLIRAVVNQVINGAEEFLKDAQAASIGLSLSPQGINATVMAEFTQGTYIAQNVTSIKNGGGQMLTGLPTGKYLAYGGTNIDPQALSKVVNDVTDPIVKELAAGGPELAPVRTYVDAFKAYLAAGKSQAFGWLAPSGAIGTDPIFQMVAVQTGDAATLSGAYSKMIQAQDDMMKAFGGAQTGATKTTIAPAAKTLDGVKFDTATVSVDANPQDPMAAQQAQMMAMIYGPKGMVMNYGAVGADKLVIGSGVSDPVLSQTIAAAKGNQAPLAGTEGVQAVSGQLPKEQLGVVYIGVGEMVTSGLGYAKQMGFNVPVQLPPDLPPIGAALSNEGGTAMRVDVHVPTSLVQSLIAAGMQAYMQMAAPGPGGGL